MYSDISLYMMPRLHRGREPPTAWAIYWLLFVQQDELACIGGQATDPYEQKTQQSPAFGRSNTPQPAHS